jgi:hypothetical protein
LAVGAVPVVRILWPRISRERVAKTAFFQVDGDMKLNENWKQKEAKKIGLFDCV